MKKNDGDLPQYYVENSHPAIIDPETFDMVQAELARRGNKARGRRTGSVFDRKVICGSCGHFYGQKLWYSHNSERDYVWRCTHKYDSEAGCQTPVIRENDLQFAFLSALNQLLGVREDYVSELEQEISAILRQKADSTDREAKAALNTRMGQIRCYLHTLRGQPELVTEFDGTAFTALVESITVQTDGDLIVRFKDGSEVPVPKSSK